MTADHDKKMRWLVVISGFMTLIPLLVFLGGITYTNYMNNMQEHRKSRTEKLSWLRGIPIKAENKVAHDAGKRLFELSGPLYPHNPLKRHVRLFEKRHFPFFPKTVKEKVNMTTPKTQLPRLNGDSDVMKIRIPRGLPKYRSPNRGRSMNLKKHSGEGKHGIDDSYFLGPETACSVPEGLQTVDIRCKRWPSYTRCTSYCVYGSTFDEGIHREHSCKYKENRWSKDFDECKPFVNCKVQLKSPGNVKCTDNELNNKPYCEIHCEIHEDKDEVKTQPYHCNANATWTPPLPFCAQLKEHVPLAKAPQVIEHTGFKYPEGYKSGTY